MDESMVSQSVGASRVQFCSFCSKPFAIAAAFKRHTAYCRRVGPRTRSHRRACSACSIAKSKCSFQQPCSRCTSKAICCVYDHPTHSSDQLADLISPTSVRYTDNLEPSAITAPSIEDTEIAALYPSASIQLTARCLSDPSRLSLPDITSDTTETRQDTPNITFLTTISSPDRVADNGMSLIIDALCAFPGQMTRRETFPCFVHPHWGSALPESLAVCMQIASLFVSRSVETKPFIWRTILSEQRRVMQQLSNIGGEDLLAAIQAHTIYLVMRVMDGASGDPDCNWEMIMSSRILCDRFLELFGGRFCEDEGSDPSLAWRAWVFAESRRRTSHIWFLISRTIIIFARADCSTTGQPWTLPLPAPKAQWEARTEENWLRELGTGSPAITTFAELLESKRRRREEYYAETLHRWNSATDNLGVLLNIAASIF